MVGIDVPTDGLCDVAFEAVMVAGGIDRGGHCDDHGDDQVPGGAHPCTHSKRSSVLPAQKCGKWKQIEEGGELCYLSCAMKIKLLGYLPTISVYFNTAT